MKKKIAIIGSGIGGLTAANLLIKNSDFEIMVYEKEKMLSLNEGYGIQLATNSISILNKIGFRNIDKKYTSFCKKGLSQKSGWQKRHYSMMVSACSGITVFSIWPSFSISTRTTSPAFMKEGGCMATPTPPGVPMKRMSPTSRT